jgi:hypothetical protein
MAGFSVDPLTSGKNLLIQSQKKRALHESNKRFIKITAKDAKSDQSDRFSSLGQILEVFSLLNKTYNPVFFRFRYRLFDKHTFFWFFQFFS